MFVFGFCRDVRRNLKVIAEKVQFGGSMRYARFVLAIITIKVTCAAENLAAPTPQRLSASSAPPGSAISIVEDNLWDG